MTLKVKNHKFMTVYAKIISALLVLCMLLTVFASCKNGSTDSPTQPVTTGGENTDGDSLKELNISGYKIIRADSTSANVGSALPKLKAVIKEKTGAELGAVSMDVDTQPSGGEILVGKTNRAESEALLSELEKQYTQNAFAIKSDGKNLIITGFSSDDIIIAIKYFVNNILSKAESGKNTLPLEKGETVIKKAGEILYSEENFGRMLVLEERSTVYTPEGNRLNEACTYGKIIKLEHQSDPKNNGILLATKENDAYNSVANHPKYPIMQSLDDGATWKEIYRLGNELNQKTTPGYQPYFFELPEDVGDFKKGTVLFVSCIRYPKLTIVLQYSTDCGKSWEGLCVVDQGTYYNQGSWSSDGVWEPILKYEDGKLYCFYSDVLDDGTGANHAGGHNQRLVYKYTSDLKNWSEKKEAVATENPGERPGMISLAKMGNGKWALVYEYVNVAVYIKFADSLDSWDAADPGKCIKNQNGQSMGSGPVISWTPDGGECGTLFVTAVFSGNSSTKCDLFMSFDYGETFISIRNPINIAPGIGGYELYGGYSPGMYVDQEGTLYYVNNPQNKKVPKQETLEFVRMSIYE